MSGIARGRASAAALIGALGITVLRIMVLGIVACATGSIRAQTSQAAPSSSSSKQVQKSASGKASTLDSGAVSAGVYHDPAFGFTCKLPAGWGLRTEEMNARDHEGEKTDAGKAATDSTKSGRVLLAAV